MNPQPDLIELSVGQAAGLLSLLLVIPITWVLLFGLRKKKRQENDVEPDWSIPAISGFSGRTTFFHAWDPRVKLAALLVFCFLTVALTSLDSAVYALMISGLSAFLCGAPLKHLGARLAAVSGFLIMLLVILPFTVQDVPGETLLILPFAKSLPFHSSGFFLGLLIACKACAIALLMEPMFGTSTMTVTLEAGRRLGVPATVIQMILLTYRYAFVFTEECRRMYRAMRVRGFSPATNLLTIRTMGNFLGMLFIRSYLRTNHVYEAMLSRGYNGTMPSYASFRASAADFVKAALWLLMGLALLVNDRLFP